MSWPAGKGCVINDFAALEGRVNNQINDFDKGYDDCINNKPALKNASVKYNEGWGLGLNFKGK